MQVSTSIHANNQALFNKYSAIIFICVFVNSEVEYDNQLWGRRGSIHNFWCSEKFKKPKVMLELILTKCCFCKLHISVVPLSWNCLM